MIGGAIAVAGVLLIAALVAMLGPEELPQEPSVTDNTAVNKETNASSAAGQELTPSTERLDPENTLADIEPAAVSAADSQEKDDAIYTARMAQLKNKFSEIAIAWHNYSEVHRQFGSDNAKHYGDDGRTLVSWRVHLLPFILGQTDLYDQFKLDEPWDSPNNLPLLDKMPDIFRSIGDAQGSTTTRFRGVESVLKSADAKPETMFMVWPEQLTPFASKRATRQRDIRNREQLVMFLEVGPENSVPWTQPGELPLVADDPASEFGRVSTRGTPVATYDRAELKIVPSTATPDDWLRLLNPSTVEPVADELLVDPPERNVAASHSGMPIHAEFSTADTIGVVTLHPGKLCDDPRVAPLLPVFEAVFSKAFVQLAQQTETAVIWLTPDDPDSPAHMVLKIASPDTFDEGLLIEAFRRLPANFMRLPGRFTMIDKNTWLRGHVSLDEKLLQSDTPSDFVANLGDISDNSSPVSARFDAPRWLEQFPQLKTVPILPPLGNIQQIDATLDFSGDPMLKIAAKTSGDSSTLKLAGQARDLLKAGSPPGVVSHFAGLLEVLAPISTVQVSSTEEHTVYLMLDSSDQSFVLFENQLRHMLVAKRDAVFRVEHQMRLKGIVTAMMKYGRVIGQLPPARAKLVTLGFDAIGNPHLSWRVHILPMLGHAELYAKFRIDEPWDSPHNIPLLNEMPDEYKVRGVQQSGYTSFMTFSGPGTPFPQGKSYTLDHLSQFANETIFAVQASPTNAVPWTKPVDLELNPANPLQPLGSVGPLFIAAYFDGGARQVSTATPPDALLRMITFPKRQ